MTLTRIQLEHVKLRIQAKAQEFADHDANQPDDMQTAINLALADGLEMALAIIEEEEQA